MTVHECPGKKSKSPSSLLIDPVDANSQQYIQLIDEVDLKLVLAVDTHIHADHVTGLGILRESTGCSSAIGIKPITPGLNV